MAAPSSSTAPPYTPAPYLSSELIPTTSQLISYFQDFYANLEYVSYAPTLVFERLVVNLKEGFTTALDRERLLHTNALQKIQDENEKLKKELAELKEATSMIKSTSSTTSLSNPAIRAFNTGEIRSSNQSHSRISRSVLFVSPYPASTGLPVGLNMLDMSNHAVLRVAANTNTQKDGFSISIDTKPNTAELHAGGCAWLEVEKDDLGFQFGKFDTANKFDFPDDEGTSYQHFITFPRPYITPPKVVIWLSKLEMHHQLDWRVKTYVTNVTATGCIAYIQLLGDILAVNGAAAMWVTYPADKPNIYSGTFSTLDIRPEEAPQPYNSGYVSFGDNVFAAPPRILIAINSFWIDCKNNLRLKAKASNVSAVGMTWHLDSWDDTILYSAGASYIALG